MTNEEHINQHKHGYVNGSRMWNGIALSSGSKQYHKNYNKPKLCRLSETTIEEILVLRNMEICWKLGKEERFQQDLSTVNQKEEMENCAKQVFTEV